jgi:hypothetical protein
MDQARSPMDRANRLWIEPDRLWIEREREPEAGRSMGPVSPRVRARVRAKLIARVALGLSL